MMGNQDVTGASQATGLGAPVGAEPCGLVATPAIPSAGEGFTIVYPFVRDTFQEFGCDDVPTWRPGHRYEDVGPEEVGVVADAEGLARFFVEAVFKPGKFPTRVFYTRSFIDPDGKSFGKTKLRIATVANFRNLIRGYRVPYGVGEPLAERSALALSREWFERALASVGRNAERQDRDGLGPQDEHATAATSGGDAQTPGDK